MRQCTSPMSCPPFEAVEKPNGLQEGVRHTSPMDLATRLAKRPSFLFSNMWHGRVWRALAKEWMLAVGGFKSLKGVQRWKELRAAVALQLLSNDPSLQQAALKCLKVGYLYLLDYIKFLCTASNSHHHQEYYYMPLGKLSLQRSCSCRKDFWILITAIL